MMKRLQKSLSVHIFYIYIYKYIQNLIKKTLLKQQLNQMLPKSRSPEIIRLHSLQNYERDRFISTYLSTLTDLFPRIVRHRLFSHPMLKNLIPDIYFTYVTICVCRKRLGEEYTYVAMCKDQHYQNQGVLVNRKYRTLVFVLEIIGRNFLRYLLQKIQNHAQMEITSPKIKGLIKCVGNSSEIISNIQWLFMMLFMLGVTKSPNLIDIKLGLGYIYTFFNQSQTRISYKFQGLLLLLVFTIKLINFFLNLKKEIAFYENQADTLKQNMKMKQQNLNNLEKELEKKKSKSDEGQVCRICYDTIEEKSCTKCGHVFCWGCIIKYLQLNPECPVCRTNCLPREVIQLINF